MGAADVIKFHFISVCHVEDKIIKQNCRNYRKWFCGSIIFPSSFVNMRYTYKWSLLKHFIPVNWNTYTILFLCSTICSIMCMKYLKEDVRIILRKNKNKLIKGIILWDDLNYFQNWLKYAIVEVHIFKKIMYYIYEKWYY